MKKKICYILPSFDTATSSHFFHLYELLKRASEELDIFLVVEKAKHPVADLPFDAYVQKFSFVPLRMAELVFVLTIQRVKGRRYFYTHYSYFGALASWSISRFLGGTAYYWNCGMPWQYTRGFFEESVFRFILRHTTLVTGTQGIAKEYVKHYGLLYDRVKILPNWIATYRFNNTFDREGSRRKLSIPNDAKVVLFVHRLSRRKGAHMILPVASEVTKKLHNVIFLIVGSGPEEESIKSEIRKWGLGNIARLAGEVPNKDLGLYFAVADVFFMPSEEEGFPHVLIEAMASGVPYAASDVGAVRDITPPVLHEFIVPGLNINWFSDKIYSLLTKSSEETAYISGVMREWVRRYDINAVLPKFVALFNEL